MRTRASPLSSLPFDSSAQLRDFFQSWYQPNRLAEASPHTARNYGIAIGHLEQYIERPAILQDLSKETVGSMLERLRASPGTVAKIRADLLAMANCAAGMGIIDSPHVAPAEYRRRKPAAWPVEDLNALFGAARTMPGMVAEIPARLWWLAFLLTLLDTGATIANTLLAPLQAYDRAAGTLALGSFVYALHSLTIDGLRTIGPGPREKLFPWPLDGGKPPFYMLYRQFRELLWRAGLPHVSRNLFDRLRVTSRQEGILDRLNLKLPFEPRPGRPADPRARDRRKPAEHIRRAHPARRNPTAVKRPRPPAKAKRDRSPLPKPVILTLKTNSPRTLRRFFEETYSPLKLIGCSKKSVYGPLGAIARLNAYAGCEVTLDQLSDDLIQGFMAWAMKRPASPATVNGYRRSLLAIWRFARRKRLITAEPLDIDKLRTPKRLPEAWSVEELARILRACAAAEGEVCGIPAGLWWPALILTLYDTGLRITAALAIRSKDLNQETRFLFVPAEVQKPNADQAFRLHPDTIDAILATRPCERERLFPWAWSDKKTLHNAYREILNRAGLSSGRRDLFHKLRRTSGTYVASVAGRAAAVEHLGHSDGHVTAFYLDPRKIERPQAGDLLPRPVWSSSNEGRKT